MAEQRDGEIALAEDPAGMAADGHLVFIGRIRSPWRTREDCPKNMRIAREASVAREAGGAGATASAVIDAPFRPGLAGLEAGGYVVLLTWLDRARRNLIVQKPRHAPQPTGVFALRSPVRPNPIGLHVVRLLGVDPAGGVLDLEAIDVLDGTPLLDVKPYLPSVDAEPEAPAGGRS